MNARTGGFRIFPVHDAKREVRSVFVFRATTDASGAFHQMAQQTGFPISDSLAHQSI
jgi:hypothetical protein